MALDVRQIADKVEALKRRNQDRDVRMANVLSVRRGEIANVYPDFFPEGMTQPMIANFIDVAARDLAEVLAPLPSFNCATVNINSDRAKAQADKRSMITNFYVQSSRLQTQMYTGSDWFLTYGFLPMLGDKYQGYGVVPHDVVADDLLGAKFIEVYSCMLFFCQSAFFALPHKIVFFQLLN